MTRWLCQPVVVEIDLLPAVVGSFDSDPIGSASSSCCCCCLSKEETDYSIPWKKTMKCSPVVAVDWVVHSASDSASDWIASAVEHSASDWIASAVVHSESDWIASAVVHSASD